MIGASHIARSQFSGVTTLISAGTHCRPTGVYLEMFGTMVVAGPTPDQIYASGFTTRRWTQPGLSGKPELHVTSGGAPPRPL